MKIKKMVAVLSAAAVVISSLALTAFAAPTGLTGVSFGDTGKLIVSGSEGSESSYTVADVKIRKNDTVTLTIAKGSGSAAMAVSVNDVADSNLTDASTSVEIKVTSVTDETNGDAFVIKGTNVNITAYEITADEAETTAAETTAAETTAAETTAAETTAAETTAADGTTAAETTAPETPAGPTITFPAGEQTLTLNANTWNDGKDHSNYQANVALFSGAAIDDVKAMTGTINIKVNLKDMSIGTRDKLNVMVIVQSSGEGDPKTGNIWEQVGSGNFASSATATIAVPASDIVAKMTESVKGTVSLLVAFGTATDDPVFTEAPVIKFTFGDDDAPSESTTAAAGSSTAAPGDPSTPNIRPVPPTTEAPATEAPAEVVTGANGESVEAPKDVVPTGATLEAKEQTKEEAVKAVEAITATDDNKEVVETVKKAIEDAKAAVMDINLVKDGKNVQPNGTLKVTINVPESLKDAANLFVYRVEDNGTFTDVKATVKDGKISFTTSHFSTYIITSEALSGDAVVTEAAVTTAPAATTAGDNSGDNGDKNQATGVILAVIPAMLAAAGVVISKKRK